MGNKLSECTPGPYETDGKRWVHGPAGLQGFVLLANAHLGDDANGLALVIGPQDSSETMANAALLELAYDHALLLAGLCSRKVLSIIRRPNNKIAILFDDFDESVSHQDCDLTPFGTPALTPELRAALQQALGVTP